MFLDYIGMVFGPIFGIMITDYYLVRKKQYAVEQFDDEKGKYWYKSGFNLVTISVWIISVIIFLFMKNLPMFTKTIGAIYPIIIISAILYFISSKIFLKNK
ncbi:cytosine permease [Clostridium ljungdahlii]